jgi:signal peptidase II
MKLQDLFKKKTLADYITFAAIIVGGIIIDQITKWLAVKFLMPIDTVPLIKIGDVEVLNLTYLENTGAAFGMLKDAPWVFNTISIIGITVMLAYLFLGHTESKISGIALAMMISGGIGNMIDRTVLHYVVDFIDFRLINFAVFNGADSFVCVGAGLLVLGLILEMKAEMKKEALKKAGASAEKSEDEE